MFDNLLFKLLGFNKQKGHGIRSGIRHDRRAKGGNRQAWNSGTGRKGNSGNYKKKKNRTRWSRHGNSQQKLKSRWINNTGYGNRRQHRVLTVYHGTPKASNVKSIRRDGWQIGAGNMHGDGIYFSQDFNEAKSYAGSQGVVIKCRVTLGKCATWGNGLNKQFQNWCKKKHITPDSSAKTAFLIKHGYKTLRAGSILVVLKPQFNNQTAWRQKVREIKICSVHNPVNKKRLSL